MDNDSIRVKHYFKIDFRTPIDRKHEYVLIKGDRRFIIECSDPEALLALPDGWEDSRVDIQHVKDCQGHICGVISETGISHNANFDSDKFVNPRKRIEDDLENTRQELLDMDEAQTKSNKEQYDKIIANMGHDPVAPTEFEIPTPGRIVLTARVQNGKLSPNADHIPAGVIKWHSEDREAEIDRWGDESFEGDKPFALRHASECVDGQMGWDWMPFQKGQAKKLEQVQAIEWMGLRTMPTDAELENRFTYHAPTPLKVEQYQLIRDEAKRLATLLLNHCPPCPELASAMDHLDTVVFKANAAIARH